ncbi:MAG: hypothetical protein LBU87_02660 [Lactobacillales bacterium]|jgi:hypothetical protein|nr:hypothetical protein [Lactobacillales bacterium]
MPKRKSNNSCNVRDLSKRFMEVRKVTKTRSPVSTGNILLDKVISSKINPAGKLFSAFNLGYRLGSEFVPAKVAYEELCKKKP